MSDKVKVGLAGYGAIAEMVHVPALSKITEASLTAVAERDSARRELAKNRLPNAIVFSDFGELLESSDVQAVLISLPNELHAEAAIRAIEKGKHIYLEKPVAVNLEDACNVVERWKASDRIAMIGFNYRFNALYLKLKSLLQSGRIGRVVAVRTSFSTCRRRLPEWKQFRKSGGGVVFDLASHHIDLLRFLFDQPVVEVSASISSQVTEDDTAVLYFKLAGGISVQSFFSISSVDEDRFDVYGDEGKLSLDRYSGFDVEYTRAEGDLGMVKRLLREAIGMFKSPYLVQKLLAPSNEPSYRAALKHFVQCVQLNRQTSPDLDDGLASLAIVDAVIRSALTGRSVILDSGVNAAQ